MRSLQNAALYEVVVNALLTGIEQNGSYIYSRDVIKEGAERLGWELNDLFEKTILAMRSCEESIRKEMDNLGL